MSKLDKEISDLEIKKAEKILLPPGKDFDDERRAVIKCLETRDIKACPGSGKTTVLLAKLLILADRMPFKDGRGICVLTHTNVAINEIKERLGGKSKVLFDYPNYFGTFQSFVDKFLAIPGYIERFNHRNIRIDQDLYEKYMYRVYKENVQDIGGFIYSKVKNKLEKKSCKEKQEEIKFDYFKELRFVFQNDQISYIENLNGKCVLRGENNTPSYSKIHPIKYGLLERGILHYDDAYSLALHRVEKHKLKLEDTFCNRFKYLFIDEMQDTCKHQNDIINKLFDNNVIIQRYGDPHQAIYDKAADIEESIWKPHNPLPLSKSMRFGEKIAQRIRTVCIENNKDLIGDESVSSLPPRIILFNDDTKDKVLERFSQLILDYGLNEFQEGEAVRPFKAIGWVGKGQETAERLHIRSYFPQYNRDIQGNKKHFGNLISYIRKQPEGLVKKYGMKVYYESITNAILRVLGILDIKTEKGRHFTVTSFEKYLKDNYEDEYVRFRQKLAEWIHTLIKDTDEYNMKVYEDIKGYILNDIARIFKSNNNNAELKDYIGNMTKEIVSEEVEIANVYVSPLNPNIRIEVGTVHSVKGETHRVTLYLETSFRPTTKHRGHESERILDFIKGNYQDKVLKGTGSIQIKNSLKMAYVGMSRPTHLLCVAIHKDRLEDNDITELKKAGWKVDRSLICALKGSS